MRTLFFVVCGLLSFAWWSAEAAVLQVNGSGILTGALRVDVGGDLFDVTFIDGACTSVFDGCNEDSDFDETSSSRALLMGQSLAEQVFIDSSLGLFDSEPSKTLGCEGTTFGFCFARIPHQVLSGVVRRAINVKNLTGLGGTQVFGGTFGSGLTSTSATFARFTPTVVPIPTALPLFGSTLFALTFFGYWLQKAAGVAGQHDGQRRSMTSIQG